MLNDILADSKTAKLFYVNDIEVLVDIIIRQLLNIPSDEMVMNEHIFHFQLQNMCHSMIYNCFDLLCFTLSRHVPHT